MQPQIISDQQCADRLCRISESLSSINVDDFSMDEVQSVVRNHLVDAMELLIEYASTSEKDVDWINRIVAENYSDRVNRNISAMGAMLELGNFASPDIDKIVFSGSTTIETNFQQSDAFRRHKVIEFKRSERDLQARRIKHIAEAIKQPASDRKKVDIPEGKPPGRKPRINWKLIQGQAFVLISDHDKNNCLNWSNAEWASALGVARTSLFESEAGEFIDRWRCAEKITKR